MATRLLEPGQALAHRQRRQADGLHRAGQRADVVLRTDALQEAGVTPPRTVAAVLASCAKLTKPGVTYGAVMRGERGNGIRYEWMQWMSGSGGSVVKDPENGDYTVTLNSPVNKTALDLFIEVAKKCGAPNPGAVSQGEVIQLLATGKALQGQLVLAAWAGLQDPKKSAVAGKLDVLPVPRLADGQHGAVIGNWNYAVPKGAKNKKAALAFARLVPEPARAIRLWQGRRHPGAHRRARVRLGQGPDEPLDAGLPGSNEDRQAGTGLPGSAQVEAVLGLKLNQALIGELSSARALNQAAQEIKAIFEKSGRKTGWGRRWWSSGPRGLNRAQWSRAACDPKPKFATLKKRSVVRQHVLRRLDLPDFKPTAACRPDLRRNVAAPLQGCHTLTMCRGTPRTNASTLSTSWSARA